MSNNVRGKKLKELVIKVLFSEIKGNPEKIIPPIIAVISFILGVIGIEKMFADNGLTVRLIDSVYYSINLFFFGLDRPELDTPLPLVLEIARWLAPLVTTFYTIKALLFLLRNNIALLQFNSGHVIICGASEKGKILGLDILKRTKDKNDTLFKRKLFVIEQDQINPNIEVLKTSGAIIINGKPQEEVLLEKVQIDTAALFFAVTDSDITNIEIMASVRSLLEKNEITPQCFVHLVNNEFQNIFMTNNFLKTNIEITTFNAYNNAAQLLFSEKLIGSNVFKTADDIKNRNKIVKIALLGFGKLGEEILIHALHLGHFYNGSLIDVTIVYDMDRDANKNVKDEFTSNFDILNKKYNGHYWNIRFIDDGDFFDKEKKQFDYSQVIIAEEESQEALSLLMKVLNRFSNNIVENDVDIAFYSNNFSQSADIIDKDETNPLFVKVRTFGQITETCKYDIVVNRSLDQLAIQNNYLYNELHGYNDGNLSAEEQWKKLSPFVKDSNRYAVQHNFIKKMHIDKMIAACDSPNNYEETKNYIWENFFYPHQEINWDKIGITKTKYGTHLTPEEIVTWGKVEHKRWNAFHILNGWDTLNIPQGYEGTIKKDPVRKLHPCLVSWDELDTVSKQNNHNYKSDDIETVMRSSIL